MSKEYTILHLPSWFPTQKDPTLGNFVMRHIDATAAYSCPIVLTVEFSIKQRKRFEIKHEIQGKIQHVTVYVKKYSPKKCFFNLLRKWSLFKAYQVGFHYIRKQITVPDLLHLHVALPAGKIALWWHFRYKISYLLTEHWSVYNVANFAQCSFMQRKWLLWIGNHAAQILPVSKNLLFNMRQCGIKTAATVIPNVVDADFFCPMVETEHSFSHRQHILHVSTLDEDAKNIWGILHVIKKLYAQRQDFILQIVHDYPRPDLEAYIENHKLTSVVLFNGRKTASELLEYYRKAAFVLLFSNYENQPCVLLEAFAVGKPVVATSVGDIPEMVNSERGRLVAPKDEQTLLTVLNEMLDNAATYNSDTIRQYVMTQFSMDTVGMKVNEIYKKYVKKIKKKRRLLDFFNVMILI